MSTPNRGVWQALANVVAIVRDKDVNTAADLRAAIGTDVSQLETEASCQYADAEGYTVDHVLARYDQSVHPTSGPADVHLSAKKFAVETIDTSGQSYGATLWMLAEWRDPRLAFDSNVYGGTLKVAASRIWTPSVFVANLVTPSSMHLINELPVTIRSDGHVSAVVRSVGESVSGVF